MRLLLLLVGLMLLNADRSEAQVDTSRVESSEGQVGLAVTTMLSTIQYFGAAVEFTPRFGPTLAAEYALGNPGHKMGSLFIRTRGASTGRHLRAYLGGGIGFLRTEEMEAVLAGVVGIALHATSDLALRAEIRLLLETEPFGQTGLLAASLRIPVY